MIGHARAKLRARASDEWLLNLGMWLACIVACPRLLESRSRTIEQTQLLNARC